MLLLVIPILHPLYMTCPKKHMATYIDSPGPKIHDNIS